MGHLPFNKLGILFPDLHQQRSNKEFICTIFPLAKKTRNVFYISSIKPVGSYPNVTHGYMGSYETPFKNK